MVNDIIVMTKVSDENGHVNINYRKFVEVFLKLWVLFNF